jgi:arylsulfatase A-like enzyme
MRSIILLTIDALRKDALSCYGGNKKTTPFIDSIQNQCIRFNHAHSGGSYTQAGFPGILTSSYYLDYGYSKDKKFNPNRVLISEPLHDQGIITAGFHSNAYLCGYFGWNRGWDMFYDSMEDEVTDKVPFIEASLMNNKVRAWLSNQKVKENPFFLWVHYMDVHEPYIPKREYLGLIDSSININEDDMFALFKGVLLKRDVSNKNTVELLRKLYLAGVRKIDDSVKELFDILQKANVLNETVVIITSDHGDEFGEHGGLSHDGKMYSELVNVPLIIFDPSLSKSEIFDKVVSTVDVPPTILHLFGLEPETKFQGHSLLPIENYPYKGVFGEAVDKYGEREKGDEFPIYYYREGDLKIIYRERNDSWEMYDLKKDPSEKENIIAMALQADDLKKKLKQRVQRWARG